MSNKILRMLSDISLIALGTLAFASIISILTGMDYCWDIACTSFIAITIAYIAYLFTKRSLDGSSRDD